MRPSIRLLANVKSASKYLEPNTPTGLTGLTTHPSPRPALLYTYRQTLLKLAQIPASSVYRQSTEALTKHRLSIVESVKPAGYDEWVERVKKQVEANPAAYEKLKNKDGSLSHERFYEEISETWDGKVGKGDAFNEGSQSAQEAEEKAKAVQEEVDRVDRETEEGRVPDVDDLEAEPPLDKDQIDEIETKIGAGLIEEVVQVADGELILVNVMLEAKPWEPLEEKAPPGQWEYFDRGERV